MGLVPSLMTTRLVARTEPVAQVAVIILQNLVTVACAVLYVTKVSSQIALASPTWWCVSYCLPSAPVCYLLIHIVPSRVLPRYSRQQWEQQKSLRQGGGHVILLGY